MHGLMRVQEKHVDDTLERGTRPKGEKRSGLTMSAQRCALVLLYDIWHLRPGNVEYVCVCKDGSAFTNAQMKKLSHNACQVEIFSTQINYDFYDLLR